MKTKQIFVADLTNFKKDFQNGLNVLELEKKFTDYIKNNRGNNLSHALSDVFGLTNKENENIINKSSDQNDYNYNLFEFCKNQAGAVIMNKKEFLTKLDAILNESKQFKGNYQIQTELFDKLQDVADEYGFDTFMQEYRNENDLFYGSDLFDLTLDNVQTSKFLDFSTIVENADVLNQFGQHQELMELWAVIDVYYNVTAVDFDEIDSAVDALKFELNESY